MLSGIMYLSPGNLSVRTQFRFTRRKPVHRICSGNVCSFRHAAAAVELAVLLPVLMTIVLGAVDFGRFAKTIA